MSNAKREFYCHKSTARWLILMSMSLFLVEIASAQQSLSLMQAWKITLQNNYSLKQQEKLIEKTELQISIDKSAYLPKILSSARYHYQSELAEFMLPFGSPPVSITAGVNNQYDLAVSLEQAIFTGFRTTNLVKAAKENYMAQDIQKGVIQKHLLLQVGRLYYGIQLNYLRQEVLKESLERVNNQLIRISNLLQAKQATSFDTLEMANRNLQLQSQWSKLRDRNEILISKLAYTLNIDYTPQIEKMQIKDSDIFIKPLENFTNLALIQRPELKTLSAKERSQDFQTAAIKSVFYPQIFARVSYHYGRPGVNIFEKQWMDYYSLQITMNWELWNWKKDSRRIQQAHLEVQRLRLQNQQLVLDITQQVKDAYLSLKTIQTQIKLQRKLVAQEEERYRITKETHVQGLATALDLSTAEIDLTEAQLALRQEYISWYQALLQLDFAAGTIGESD